MAWAQLDDATLQLCRNVVRDIVEHGCYGLDDAALPAWNARKARNEATVKAARGLIDAAYATMPTATKPDMRPAWLHDKLTEEQSK